jgi:hypothetical protein
MIPKNSDEVKAKKEIYDKQLESIAPEHDFTQMKHRVA